MAENPESDNTACILSPLWVMDANDRALYGPILPDVSSPSSSTSYDEAYLNQCMIEMFDTAQTTSNLHFEHSYSSSAGDSRDDDDEDPLVTGYDITDFGNNSANIPMDFHDADVGNNFEKECYGPTMNVNDEEQSVVHDLSLPKNKRSDEQLDCRPPPPVDLPCVIIRTGTERTPVPTVSGIMHSPRLPPTPPSSDSDNDSRQSPSLVTFKQGTKMSAISLCKIPFLQLNANKSSEKICGQLLLSDEEKRTLATEGFPQPTKLPLSKTEETYLKKVRRKIKNKISAQESRRKKKEYVDALEKKVESCSVENAELRKRVESLEKTNKSLVSQMQMRLKDRRVVMRNDTLPSAQTSTQTGTCLMLTPTSFDKRNPPSNVVVESLLDARVSPLSPQQDESFNHGEYSWVLDDSGQELEKNNDTGNERTNEPYALVLTSPSSPR